MYQIIKSNPNEREIMFKETAQKMNMSEAVVEKNFWACFMFDYLFHKSKYRSLFAFKPYSKEDNAREVKRFADDLMLTLDYENSKFKTTESFLQEELLPLMTDDLSNSMGQTAEIAINKNETSIISFTYPRIFLSDAVSDTIEIKIY